MTFINASVVSTERPVDAETPFDFENAVIAKWSLGMSQRFTTTLDPCAIRCTISCWTLSTVDGSTTVR